MPDLEWNVSVWDGNYNWDGGGEEWSKPWGTSEAEWFGTLYPRIHRHVPARSILEIAPGFGRWTRFLIPLCEEYRGVDLSTTCIESCDKRFCKATNATFVKNDGRSIPFADDVLFDFVFSFDSLVHVDLAVLEAYIKEIIPHLTPGGVAFIHHSNAAACGLTGEIAGCRSPDVSGLLVNDLIVKNGGHVLTQENINWDPTKNLLDCITVFSKKGGLHNAETQIFSNDLFTTEMCLIQRIHHLYSPEGK